MSNGIQLLTLQEWARKYGVKDPYDKSEYDWVWAYRNNITPNVNGQWPTRDNNDG